MENLACSGTPAHLNRSNVSVLSNVLVLVETIFGKFAFLQIDRELDEKKHNRLQRGNRTIAGSLGRDMFMEDRQCRWSLANGDELLCSLYVG